MPGSMAAAGHVAQLPPDSQCDECRSPTPWCFPLAPEGSPQSQADPASESDQHLGRLAEAEIAAPTPHIWVCSLSTPGMPTTSCPAHRSSRPARGTCSSLVGIFCGWPASVV